MKKQKEINIFVPAQALEYHQNGEQFSLKQKLGAAVDRVFQTGDFFEPVAEPSYVFVGRMQFHPDSLGYTVQARIC